MKRKLSEFRETFEDFSGRASNGSRQLAFAGIAIVWIFKAEVDGRFVLDYQLQIAAFLLTISLTMDLLQYVYAAIAWGIFYDVQERKQEDPSLDPELHAPRWMNWPTNVAFYSKVLLVISAYIFLINYVAGAIGVV